jgi:hypothetical protein
MWKKIKIIWSYFENIYEGLNIPPRCKGIKKQNKKHVNYMLVDQEVNHIRWTNLVKFAQV